MNDRKESIKKLETLINISGNKMSIGKMECYFLPNIHTHKLCQVIELVNESDEVSVMDNHIHDESREVFYQLVGTMKFGDGKTLSPGEYRVIEPKVQHKIELSPGGKAIIIVHPIEKHYPLGV